MTHPVPSTDPDPRALCPDCGHAADKHNQLAGCTYRNSDDWGCTCSLTFGEIVDTARVRRIAELEAALETALRYLEHPEVKAIPFALPVSSVSEYIRALLGGAK